MTIDNKQKVILDLCGGTGAWSKPYKDAGYDVRVITLPEYDVCDFEVPENVHGILAAPPCTEFSLAKGNGFRDFRKAMKIVKSCLEVIWIARYDGKLKWWCLENPRGFLRQFLGNPPHTISYWWYGDELEKPTDLWGYYNLPAKIYTEPPILLKKIQSMPGGNLEDRTKRRAKTPPGFAKAFFKVNQ